MSYDPVPPFRRDFDAARDPYTARNALGIPETTGGAPAPVGAEYITASADATLTNERVLTNTATVTWDFSVAGQAKANVAVSYQPSDPTLTALAAYNSNGLLTQTAPDNFTGRTLTGPAAGITVSNGNGVSGNPTLALANDLAALEALSGTSTIYYRSGTDAWSAVTIGTGLSFSSGTLSATASAPTDEYHHGRLQYLSATALWFKPFNGNKIKINGVIYTIPTAGMAGLANTGVFVNGTGSSNLAASTTYYVYAFLSSGTPTGDFRTDGNGHVTDTTSGNEGVEVRCSSGTTPDTTRTLIGICRTNASSQFVDSTAVRGVLSWFNQRPRIAQGKFTADRTTTSASMVEINSEIAVGFLTWSDASVLLATAGATYISSAGSSTATQIYVDGAALDGGLSHGSASASISGSIGMTAALGGLNAITEGYHTATLYGTTLGTAGTATWVGGTAQNRCTLTAQIWG